MPYRQIAVLCCLEQQYVLPLILQLTKIRKLSIKNVSGKNFPKNLGATSKFLVAEHWHWNKFYTQKKKKLEANFQNLFALDCASLITDIPIHETNKNKTGDVRTHLTQPRSLNHCCRGEAVLYILHVSLEPPLSSTKSACAILYCHLWPVRLSHIFTHYLVKGMIFRKMLLVFLSFDFLDNFCLKHFSS